MKIYITFDEGHTHHINGIQYDQTCVAIIDAVSMLDGLRLAEAHFQDKYGMVYDLESFRTSGKDMLSRRQIVIK